MALLPYEELVKIDVLPRCDMRKAKDDNGKTIEVPYLNWATCIELLHENGAKDVWYTPRWNAEHGYLFVSAEVSNKDGRKTGCYFVSVDIHIDDMNFTMDMPLLNGSLVVYEDTLNQLRISNSHARAFVKGVAIRTGLGFNLWAKERDTDSAADDLSMHDIRAIKTRIDQLMTAKMQRQNLSQEDVCDRLKINKRQLGQIITAFDNIYWLESELKKL